MNTNSRRRFLKNTLAGSAMLAIGLKGWAETLNIWSSSDRFYQPDNTSFETSYEQTPLPYAYSALEDIIDAATMEIHYSKHASTYAKNLKETAVAEKIDTTKPLEEALAKTSAYSTKFRNNGGGHYNHELFWKCMRPKQDNNKPSGRLLEKIESSYGSFEQFKIQFTDAAKTRFGSGWAWLYINQGQLKIGSTANQDNPLMDLPSVEHKGFPVLCLDVWEHAYYLKYQNKRADYIENWWKLVNWDYVESRLNG
jgi:Fe-Mn family superoxide dismutase